MMMRARICRIVILGQKGVVSSSPDRCQQSKRSKMNGRHKSFLSCRPRLVGSDWGGEARKAVPPGWDLRSRYLHGPRQDLFNLTLVRAKQISSHRLPHFKFLFPGTPSIGTSFKEYSRGEPQLQGHTLS